MPHGHRCTGSMPDGGGGGDWGDAGVQAEGRGGGMAATRSWEEARKDPARVSESARPGRQPGFGLPASRTGAGAGGKESTEIPPSHDFNSVTKRYVV